MSNRISAGNPLKASHIAVFVVFISLCAVDIVPAAERTSPAPSQGIEQTTPLQHLALGSQPLTGNVTPDQRQQAMKAFDLSPAVFVENKGQWDSCIRYGFDGKGTRVSFTDAGPVFQMTKRAAETGEVSQTVFSATFVGGRKVPPVGIEKSPSTTNYYIGSDPSKWQSSVPSFQKVAYLGLYEGVDLYTWGKRCGLKYEFHVAPRASWKQIVVRYEGIEGLSIDDKGALHVNTPLGEIVDAAPVVYQDTSTGRVEITARYSLVDESSYGFDITGALDPSLPLVIDPSLAWGSYLGGSGYDGGRGIAVDALGNCYVTGWTNSSDLPTPGGFDTSYNGNRDAFVAKVTSSGQLEWASYLGGSSEDAGNGIAADASGNSYVVGYTESSDFPTPGGFDTSYNSGGDVFLAKVTSSGQLEWASFLGGSSYDEGSGIAVDTLGDCYVTGETKSSDLPVPGGFDTTYNGDGDAFVAKVTSSGQLEWASYLGGGGRAAGYIALDQGTSIAVDASGNCYVTGVTWSTDFPTPGGFDTSFNGYCDAFVAKITTSGQLAWASYLGGSGDNQDDEGFAIAADALGNSYITGFTESSYFPTPGGFDTCLNTDQNVFLAKVSSSGQLAWASYFGGSTTLTIDSEKGSAIAVDALGNFYVTGYTETSDFPTPGAFDRHQNGGRDAFVAKVASSGQLEWSSYLGGSDRDEGNAIAVDALGIVYVTGYTRSSDLPTPAGFDTCYNGNGDAFVVKIGAYALAVVTDSLPDGVVGHAYSEPLVATAGSIPYTWSIASGGLPDGLSLDASSGVISGTPRVAGTCHFTVKVTDSLGGHATKALSIAVSAQLAVDTAYLPEGVVGMPYSATLEASGGLPPYAWSIPSGTLPEGLSLDPATGVIDGTPAAEGTSCFTVMVTDAQPRTATKALSIEIYPALPPLVFNWLEIAKFQVGLPATAGQDSFSLRGLYNWRFTAGAWPPPVTVTIGDWSVTVNQADWKRVGKSCVYTFKQGDVAGKFAFLVRGTSKCLFSLKASRQTLQGHLPQWPHVPVRLQCGEDFDETLTANFTVKGTTGKLSSVGPLPLFYTERIIVNRNIHLAGHDALSYSGKVFLDRDFDPAVDSFIMHIGPYEILLPVGTMSSAASGVARYTALTPNGKLTFTLNNRNHQLKVTATGIEMPLVTQDIEVSLLVTHHPGAVWNYGLRMATNSTHTQYKY